MHPLYQFIQTPTFTSLLDETKEPGLLEAIEAEIIRNPQGGSLLRGGMRKIRVPSTRRAEGKSGGYRVWFYHHVPDNMLLLFLLDKRESADLTPAQEEGVYLGLKKVLKQLRGK